MKLKKNNQNLDIDNDLITVNIFVKEVQLTVMIRN